MHPTATEILHHIDTPSTWAPLPRCMLVRGWCFDPRGRTIRAIRLRAGDLTISSVVGLPRPDVKAAMALAPDDNTGFELRGTLPAGRLTLVLEAQTADGEWRELQTRKVTVRRPLLPRWMGGGSVTELIAFQMPAHGAYPARPVLPEKFPIAKGEPARRPKFSIVTPSFQQAPFLPETMRSVLDQAGVECEYVVQDGGSTDGSVEIIQRLAQESSPPASASGSQLPALDFQLTTPSAPNSGSSLSTFNIQHSTSSSRPHLIAWESAPDAGQADGIARGFAKTSGSPDDVMAWLNSDDFYLPGILAYVADYFARHPEADVLYGHRIVVNEESREIARWFLPKHDDAVLRLNDFVPQESLFWRRRIWTKAGGLDLSFKFAMDWDLLLRFQAAGAKIVRVPYFLACFRVHPGQKTSAAMHDVGQREIDLLRARANGRVIPALELERHPRLLGYLRRSAFIEFLWKLGVRAS